MALVLGVNSGFVTTAPTADPAGGVDTKDRMTHAIKDTSPATAIRVTEIGWWCDTASEEADFEVGIYTDAGAGEPELLVGKSSATAKGTTAGWKKVSGLNIVISSNTAYWIAIQLDDTATATNHNYAAGSYSSARLWPTTTLDADWGTSYNKYTDRIFGFYAVWSAEAPPPTGTNQWINVDDTYRQLTEAWVNVDDSWRKVKEAWINVDDVWRKLYSI